jgi:hypothetical protein
LEPQFAFASNRNRKGDGYWHLHDCRFRPRWAIRLLQSTRRAPLPLGEAVGFFSVKMTDEEAIWKPNAEEAERFVCWRGRNEPSTDAEGTNSAGLSQENFSGGKLFLKNYCNVDFFLFLCSERST